MKKTIIFVLIAVLSLGVMSACGKKESENAQPAQANLTGKEVEVVYEYDSQTVRGSVALPECGGIDEEKEQVEDKGGNFISIYATANKEVYCDAELYLSVVKKEVQEKTLAGKREASEGKAEKMEINGCAACLYENSKDSNRCRTYYIYTTDSQKNIVEMEVYLQDAFSDLSKEEWAEICKAVENTTKISFDK